MKEAFIGIMPCDGGLTFRAVLGYIKDTMIRCSFDANKLVAVSFDGALKCIARLIKEDTYIVLHTAMNSLSRMHHMNLHS